MEYTDSKKPIIVSNLPIEKSITQLAFASRGRGFMKEVLSIIDGLSKIEEVFLDIIDLQTKLALKNINTIEFHVAGGKAINNIIKKNHLFKSFDFDIHVKNHMDVQELSKKITESINNELRQPWNMHIRNQIFKKLEKLNYVSDNEKNYYLDESNDLIYYGKRMKNKDGIFGISGLFIKLKLKDNLFERSGATVKYNNYMRTDDFVDHDPYNTTDNIIYVPFSDIDAEESVNLGIVAYKSRNPNLSFITVDRIKYLDFVMLVYNVIQYATTKKFKIESNLNKIKNIIRTLHTNCTYYNSINISKIRESVRNIADQLLDNRTIPNNDISENAKATLRIVGDVLLNYKPDGKKGSLFKKERPELKNVVEYLSKIINNYLGFNDNFRSICFTTLHMTDNRNNDPKYIRFLDRKYSESNQNIICGKLEQLTAQSDINSYIAHYTLDLFKSTNSYLNLKENGLPTDKFSKYNKGLGLLIPSPLLSNRNRVDITNISLRVDTVPQVEQAVMEIDKVFDNFQREINNLELSDDELTAFGANSLGKKLKDYISDSFTVYSFQLIFNCANIGGTYENISNFKPGDIIVYPQYLSTTWKNTTDLKDIANPIKTLLRVTIKKNNKNWIFINKYSQIPSEYEILIKRNSVFCVKSNDITVVNIRGTDYDVNIIDLELLDSVTAIDLNNIIVTNMFLKSGSNSYYDNPLKSELFREGIGYVYIQFLMKEYKDAKDLIAKGVGVNNTGITTEPSLSLDINGTREIIHRHNHGLVHTLRVCSWIYLYGLYLIKYNPEFKNIITPKFLVQICVAGLFLITGRDSETGARDKVDHIKNLSADEKSFYNTAHARYRIQSARNFVEFIEKIMIEDIIYTREEIKDFEYCIENYYFVQNKIHTPETQERNNKPINILISKLFYLSHMIDLIRCKADCEFTVPINDVTHPNYETESKNIRDLTIKLCAQTGDRILSGTFIDLNDTTKRYSFSGSSKQYDSRTFYENSTNFQTCLTTILNIITPHSLNIIYDIEEQEHPYIHPNYDITLDVNSRAGPVASSAIGPVAPPSIIVPPPEPGIPPVPPPKPIVKPVPPPSIIVSPPKPGIPPVPPPKPIVKPVPPPKPIDMDNTLDKDIEEDRREDRREDIREDRREDKEEKVSLVKYGGGFENENEDDYETNIQKMLLDTENSVLGTTIYCPLSIVDKFSKISTKNIVPFISEFNKNIKDDYIYTNKLIQFYQDNGLFEKTKVNLPTIKELKVEILNQLTPEKYIKQLEYLDKINQKNNIDKQNKLITYPENIINSINRYEIPVVVGGNYYQKYLKYKQKYYELKKKLK